MGATKKSLLTWWSHQCVDLLKRELSFQAFPCFDTLPLTAQTRENITCMAQHAAQNPPTSKNIRGVIKRTRLGGGLAPRCHGNECNDVWDSPKMMTALLGGGKKSLDVTYRRSAFLGIPFGTVFKPRPWQSTCEPEQLHLCGHPMAGAAHSSSSTTAATRAKSRHGAARFPGPVGSIISTEITLQKRGLGWKSAEEVRVEVRIPTGSQERPVEFTKIGDRMRAEIKV